MSAQEKKELLEEISKLKATDKAYVQGWCAHAVATADKEEGK